MPHCCIGVDVIVGFPGESEEDFMETYRFLNELDIAYLHVFTYSERPNTEAAGMEESVPKQERKKRNRMLRTLSEKKRSLFYEAQLGSRREVLFEYENENGFISGFTDNYIRVKASYDPALVNQIRKLSLESINRDGSVLAPEQEQAYVS